MIPAAVQFVDIGGLVEQVVEVDDAAMEKYLEEGAVDPTSLHAPLEKALREKARLLFAQRLEHYAAILGVHLPPLTPWR